MSNVSNLSNSNNPNNPNPFSKGVWILAMLGGCDIIALVEESQSEQDLKNELATNKCVCVTLKKRYILKQLQFPMPEMDARGKHTGGWNTGAIATVGKHEIGLELLHEFPVYASLTSLSFLSDFHRDDVERLRLTVNAADKAADIVIRATNANILIPNRGM